jgi:hypothetical protein
MTISKGFIRAHYDIYCKCGYIEQLQHVFGGDTSNAAKKQGWTWDVERGWMCPVCSDMFSKLSDIGDET